MFYAGENVFTNPGRRIKRYNFPIPPPFADGRSPGTTRPQYSQPPQSPEAGTHFRNTTAS